ncbi:CDP-glycerol glycerophosphotransferase family protein [Enterococcus sp. FR202]|uniref:CDP-glycerol glycerophosphotransferase family protein n=1 Tax=Enterococcus TaxID=1350 RepID=UPI00189C1588|nr:MULTISPECIES: CDP-glycerol glycerophosphotransferase family protein [Enterococcus]MCR9047114.1 CDP-glycerol glycerophosphotransferase family protein [Enterococcus faecium]MDQ8605842.1 CDP-glycerol glycerophosphotransferase family protein [Enterococcus sp. FR202]MDQ8628949.1 CDP-glycerol glycerophosphotransferase family protein [Enterococcus sp. FR204]MDQ8660799.1 CDP-glycerol glycerophosphotransferase family protein [Enterococcus sp. FR205]MDQ8668286.1 CDP-glycerol glycerophosphotransferase
MQKLKDLIKNSAFISQFFFYALYLFYFILDHLLKKEKKIIFTSFSGRQFSDSPKVLFELISEDSRFKEYELVWAFNEPDKFQLPSGTRSISINSLSFFKELFSSSVWISNTSIEKLVPYKSKKIFYLNTWHGIPLKKIGKDETHVSSLVKKWYTQVQFDLLTVCGDYDDEIFKTVFPSSPNHIKTGLPRNLLLVQKKDRQAEIRKSFIEKHGLKEEVRLVLYAPTFREFKSSKVNHIFNGDILPDLDSDTVLLLRTHYFEKINLERENVINVSDEDLDELLLSTDCLISDYSSMMFDFYLLDKPIYMYAYDYDEYRDFRGFYVDMRETYNIPILNEDGLNEIYHKDDTKYQINKTLQIVKMLKTVDVSKLLDALFSGINNL